MALAEISILGANLQMDNSGDIFPDKIKDQLALASAPGEEGCIVMKDPNGSGDEGIYGNFRIPQNYSGGTAPKIIIRGVLDGAPVSTTIAFGFQKKALADDEAYDAALGAQQIASAASVSQADEDEYEETIDLTGSDYVVGDTVDYFFFIDDSVHTFTGNFLLRGLFFQYTVS